MNLPERKEKKTEPRHLLVGLTCPSPPVFEIRSDFHRTSRQHKFTAQLLLLLRPSQPQSVKSHDSAPLRDNGWAWPQVPPLRSAHPVWSCLLNGRQTKPPAARRTGNSGTPLFLSGNQLVSSPYMCHVHLGRAPARHWWKSTVKKTCVASTQCQWDGVDGVRFRA